MNAMIWAANILGWPMIHVLISSIFVRLPAELFAGDNWLTTPRRWETNERLYRDWLAIRRWKSLLPDGAPWLGGISKKKLSARNIAYLKTFMVETNRAETAHWCTLGCIPIFFIWNPPWACLVMAAYAFAANLPCILAQRYNRIVLRRLTDNKKIARITS